MSDHAHTPSDDPTRVVFFVCQGPGCGERGGARLVEQMRGIVASSPARRHVRVCTTSCMDSCATGPNVMRTGDGGLHTGVDAAQARALVEQQIAALGLPAEEPRAPVLRGLPRPAAIGVRQAGGFGDAPPRAAHRAV
ncbi:MAG: (2Fe-2S) ferredoxin domain-containing protein [Planctomycetes bacterium]|nr:(2Fe-2S) ferredoxin domain-containing protein [Planctomycetota bacterium]